MIENVYNMGTKVWADDVNSRGGINGRKIALRKIDERNSIEGARAACIEALNNGSFATIIISQLNLVIMDCLETKRHPSLAVNASTTSPTWTYGHTVLAASVIGERLAEFVKGPLGQGENKIGIIYTNTPNQAPTANQFQIAGKRLGLNIVGVEKVAEGQESFVAELSRLRSAGAKAVVLVVALEAVGILRDARAIDYQPVWTGDLWAVDEISAGASELMTGIRAIRGWATTDSPAYTAYLAKTRAVNARGNPTTSSMAFYAQGIIFGGALERAGQHPTRDSLLIGFRALQGFDTGMLPPVSWKSGSSLGSEAMFPVICCNEDRTWRGLGPARATFR